MKLKPEEFTTLQTFIDSRQLSKTEYNMMMYVVRTLDKKKKIPIVEKRGPRKYYRVGDLRDIYKQIMSTEFTTTCII